MKTFITHHGETVYVNHGEFVLLEYYKGFLNAVNRYALRDNAVRAKEMKQLHDSYNMQKNYHWSIQEVK